MSLNDSTDPLEWSEEFMKVVKEKGVEVDEDFMLGWFANAIMAGFDKAPRKNGMGNEHE